MTDWDQLQEIGRRVSPPPFDGLVATARKRDRRRRMVTGGVTLIVLAALGIGIGVVGEEGGIVQPAESPSISTPTPTGAALPDGVLPLPVTGPEETVALDAGRYRIPLSDTLSLDIDLAQGTDANADGLYLASGNVLIKSEAAGETFGIPRDPCTNIDDITAVGPTVADLVTAIRTQPLYRASRPEPVEIGGASGQYLELRIPRQYDASTCTDNQVGLPGSPESTNNMEPGYVGQWWILDVAGQRAVIQTYCDQCDPDELEQATTAVQGITFTPAP